MVFEGLKALARGDVPQFDGLVIRDADERDVRHSAYTLHLTRMSLKSFSSRFPCPIP